MKFMRFGPSILFLQTQNPEAVRERIERIFGVNPIPAERAIKESNEFETVLFVMPERQEKTVPPETGFLIRDSARSVLSGIINNRLPVEEVHAKSTIIFLRVPEKVNEALKLLSKEFGGEILPLMEALERGEAGDTTIAVTRKRLSCPLGPEEVEGSVLVRERFIKVYRRLSTDVPLLLLKLLPEWKDITIKIYDTERRYEENIARVMMVLEDLDLGFVVGEGWDWDYPRPLMRVPVYKLKLLTWEDPVRVKFLLKGLEYRDYVRLCDIDVFVEGKKIDWVKLGKFDSKFELAKAAREELENNLSEDVKKRLYEIEEKLLREKR